MERHTRYDVSSDFDPPPAGVVALDLSRPAEREIVERVLIDAGHRLIAVDDPDARPDVLLTDAPYLDAAETPALDDLVRDAPPATLVLRVIDPTALTRALPADDVLLRPLDSGAITWRVDRLLRRRQLEAAVRSARQEAERSEAFRESLVHMVAHDLRSPLAVIQSNVGMLLDEEEVFDLAETSEMLRESMAATQRLGWLVDTMIDLSRLQQARVALNRVDADLRDWARDAITRSAAIAEWHTVRLDLPTAPVPCRADAGLTVRVISHLIQNAINFSAEGGVIVVRACAATDRARIEVDDPGTPVPEDERSSMFDAFTRRDGKRGKRSGGVGLGLAFCRQAISAHGGEIGVEDAPAGGARFWFELPAPPAC